MRDQVTRLERDARTRFGAAPDCHVRLDPFDGHMGSWFEVSGASTRYELHAVDGGPAVWVDSEFFGRLEPGRPRRLRDNEIVHCGGHVWMFFREDGELVRRDASPRVAERGHTEGLLLEAIGGKAGGRRLDLGVGTHSIGSSPRMDLFIPDARIPADAFRVTVGPGGDLIMALSELVLVNLRPLARGREQQLNVGDRIRCGDTDFVVRTSKRDSGLNQDFLLETSSEQTMRAGLALGVQLNGASTVLTYEHEGVIGRPQTSHPGSVANWAQRNSGNEQPNIRRRDEVADKAWYWEICRIAPAGVSGPFETVAHFETLDELHAIVDDRIGRALACPAVAKAMANEGPFSGFDGSVRLGYRLEASSYHREILSLALCHIYYSK
jgi:hypothetical protein